MIDYDGFRTSPTVSIGFVHAKKLITQNQAKQEHIRSGGLSKSV